MTPALFKKRLCEHGFAFSHTPAFGGRFERIVDGTSQYVARDSIRGSAWRLFLAVGEVSQSWPTMDLSGNELTAMHAESPWFQYFSDLDASDPLDAQCDSREAALEKCFNWLTTVGFQWLKRPTSKTPEEWRKAYNILPRKL